MFNALSFFRLLNRKFFSFKKKWDVLARISRSGGGPKGIFLGFMGNSRYMTGLG